jgi:CRP/FNR family transcriptional regulator, cyclic AMP receptor protein
VPDRRLAKRLLALAASYGAETAAGVRIEVRLPQPELGELVGATRESIDEQLRAWQQEGLLDVERGTITLRDSTALQREASFLLL